METEILIPAQLNVDPEFNTNPSGNGSISRFNNYQYGATFPRIVKTVNETGDIMAGSPFSYFNYQITRPDNTILYGRLCVYPVTDQSYWTQIAEEEYIDNPASVGRKPFIPIRFKNDKVEFMDLNAVATVGEKVVIQLLFVEL